MTCNVSRDYPADEGPPPVKIDTTVPHLARVQDYWLGGRDNFAADRQAGDEAIAAFPGLVANARSARAFLDRTVRYLAAEAGIRQFLDIGAGIPAAGNTHEIAQSVAPEAMVVYLDNDPVVFTHGRRMLASGPHGSTAYLDGDLRDPGHIVAEAARMLDLSQPVALVLMAVLQFIADDCDPHKIVAMLLEALPPGSYLVIGHPLNDTAAAGQVLPLRLSQLLTEPVTPRLPAEVARFFDGLHLVRPGLVRVPQWRPTSVDAAAAASTMWGGVGRK